MADVTTGALEVQRANKSRTVIPEPPAFTGIVDLLKAGGPNALWTTTADRLCNLAVHVGEEFWSAGLIALVVEECRGASRFRMLVRNAGVQACCARRGASRLRMLVRHVQACRHAAQGGEEGRNAGRLRMLVRHGPASRATCFACIVCVIVSGLSKPVGPWLNKPVGPRLSKPAGPCGGQSLLGLPSKPEGYDASIRANLKSG
eukprot:1161619-Pelagomonas_calceolata.AAC.8